MNPSDHTPPPPPPDDQFSRMVEGALNDTDFSLTENRRAAVLKAFADAAQAGGGQRRRVIHLAWWLAAGAAAAACVTLWLAGAFSASTAPGTDSMARTDSTHVHSPEVSDGERLAQANLRLAVLSEQLSRAEHQLIWLRARAEKIP